MGWVGETERFSLIEYGSEMEADTELEIVLKRRRSGVVFDRSAGANRPLGTSWAARPVLYRHHSLQPGS